VTPYATASKGRGISRAMRSTVPWPTPKLMPQVNCSLFDRWRAVQAMLRDLKLRAVKIVTV